MTSCRAEERQARWLVRESGRIVNFDALEFSIELPKLAAASVWVKTFADRFILRKRWRVILRAW